VAENKGGGTTLIGAAIVGVAILAGSFFVANALNRVTVQVDKTATGLQEIKTALADAKTALQQAAKAQPAKPAPRRRGPDPDKVHKVNIAGAPIKGPKTAKVKIIEFSDFQ
jgi:outer membrane murein-binding lipoprotein Lpp